jgi:RND family efflux transporter MFP subunit
LDQGYPFTGALDYVDQEGVDQETGTFGVRAVFENPDGLILPGLFVRVRVPLVEPENAENALLIPEKALLRDQQGSFVLLCDQANQVERRNVTAGQRIAGMVVIEEGLSLEDLILLEGGQRARPGTEVQPTTETLEVPPGLSDQALSPDSPDPVAPDAEAASGASDAESANS